MKDSVDALLDGYGRTISVPDLVDLFGVSRQTIYAWLKTGQIPAHQLPNGAWIVITADVAATLRAGTNQPATKDEETQNPD